MQDRKSPSPIAWIPTAYFAMGLPFVAVSLAAVIMFADLGIDEASITFWTSLLILPYSIKPLWSPLLELYYTKKHFALACQMIVGFCFGLIVFLLPLPDTFLYVIGVMWIITICGATNDIATDGIYLTAIDKTTQAKYIGWQGAFYNLAKVLVNGGLVYLAGTLMGYFKAESPENAARYAWMIIMGIIACVMIGIAVYHRFFMPVGSRNEESPDSFSDAMSSLLEVFKDFFTKKHIWVYIIFIVCYRLTEGFAVKMVPLFLKAPVEAGGLGLSNESIGLIYGTLGTVAFIVGSILGGYYIARFGLKKVLFSLVCIFNIPFVIYLLLAQFQPDSLAVIATGLVVEYFCYGFGFVGLTLFMMQQVAPGKHPMAHYAFASGIMNLGFMLPGMISGYVYQHLGYEMFFTIALAMSVPAFILAAVIPFAHKGTDA
ncbi:MAG: AmpG family muropeptide MFS transporter [Bacteroides sp.]|nr:AmpG family muropeptide MFS transporter [Bacteroides sp.]